MEMNFHAKSGKSNKLDFALFPFIARVIHSLAMNLPDFLLAFFQK